MLRDFLEKIPQIAFEWKRHPLGVLGFSDSKGHDGPLLPHRKKAKSRRFQVEGFSQVFPSTCET
ncbi:MAG: hypothetical protein DKT66_21150 [Candidatus Melainabacteria bacterium]|nr:MAG: hypothetical protein DKT66_21150 [Candidatus Melainabacteria bacterium]